MNKLFMKLRLADVTAQKVPKLKVGPRGQRDLSNIGLKKINDKIVTDEQWQKHIKKLGIDPEELASTISTELEKMIEVDEVREANGLLTGDYVEEESDQDVEPNEWMTDPFDSTKAMGPSAEALQKLRKLVPSLDEWLEEVGQVKLSFSLNAGGYLPHSACNAPKDAVFHSINGEDGEAEIQYDTAYIADAVGIDEELVKLALPFVENDGHVCIRYREGNGTFEAYGRYQVVWALYWKLDEIMEVITENLDDVEPEHKEEVDELIEEMEKNAGEYS